MRVLAIVKVLVRRVYSQYLFLPLRGTRRWHPLSCTQVEFAEVFKVVDHANALHPHHSSRREGLPNNVWLIQRILLTISYVDVKQETRTTV